MPNVTIQLAPISEGATAPITGRMEAPDGTPIPGSAITALTVTLTNAATGVVINSRSGTNILGVNGGSVDVDGNFVWETTPTDNVIVDNARRKERHIARFDWTYSSGKKGRSLFQFDVVNFVGVT